MVRGEEGVVVEGVLGPFNERTDEFEVSSRIAERVVVVVVHEIEKGEEER